MIRPATHTDGMEPMNYFPFHIGDYAAHTAHLEPMEDLAYRRLMDLYYLREEPLPASVQELARLIRLRQHTDAIQAVLDEFFVLTEEGWRSERCENEIAEMRARQEATESREEHEKERMRRHRERRSKMFDALRAVGVVPPYDIGTRELQRLYEEKCDVAGDDAGDDLKRDGNVAGAFGATAVPTPTPTPTPKKNNTPRAVQHSAERPEGVDEVVWNDFLALRTKQRAPLTSTAIKRFVSEAAKAGLSVNEVLELCCSRGWRGFSAEWVKPGGRSMGGAGGRHDLGGMNYGKGGFGDEQ